MDDDGWWGEGERFLSLRNDTMAAHDKSQDRYFPSKRDGWIVGVIWGSLLISVVGGMIPLALPGNSLLEAILVVVVLVAMDGLMLWVLYGTGYWVTQDLLLIRCGPLSFRVRLADIESITPTRSLLSSPACSIDRLKIVYGFSQQSLMISPADKPGFLSAIVQQCPHLVVLDNQVRKKTDASSSAVVPTNHPQVTV
jgi:hypothetical protein